jgi:hypothetical protein
VMHVVSVPHFWLRTQIAFLSSHDDAFWMRPSLMGMAFD